MSFTLLRQPKEVSAVRMPMGIEIQADAIWNTYDSYYLKLIVEYEPVYRSGTFAAIDGEIWGWPDDDSRVVWDIHRLLAGIPGNEVPSLTMAANAWVASEMNRRYRFTVEEYIDGSLVTTSTSSIKHVLNAGFAFPAGQNMYSYAGTLQFLTHQPRTKKVTTVQPEFLYYFAWTPAELTLTLDLVHSDGSTTVGYDPGITLDVEAYDVAVFAVSWERLGLDTVFPDVVSWEIIMDSDVSTKPISERMGYEISPECSPLDRYYMFQNSLGGYDTLRTIGELEVSEQTESQTAERIMSPWYESSEKSYDDFNILSRGDYIQHTGFLNYAEAMWLRDLLRSKDLYRIGDINPNPSATGTLMAIRIPPGRFPVRKDNEFVEGIRFQYQDAYNNRGL